MKEEWEEGDVRGLEGNGGGNSSVREGRERRRRRGGSESSSIRMKVSLQFWGAGVQVQPPSCCCFFSCSFRLRF